MKTSRSILASLFVSALAAPNAWAVQQIQVIAKQGDIYGGRTISSVNAPFVDGNGKVGFVASFNDSTRGVWHNRNFVFNSSDALPLSLTGSESTMGVSNTGGFIYSPSVDGGDAVYTHGGTLLRDDDPIASLPGRFSTFNSRPTMAADGTAYWMGGTGTAVGGSTSNRHLFKATDPTDPLTITAVFSGGDIINGLAVDATASNFDYCVSDNNLHHIHAIDMVTGLTTNDIHIMADGLFVAQEGTPTGFGDNWSAFDAVSINNVGKFIFSGETNGAVATDYILMDNGAVGVREGDTIDSVTLASGAAVRWASINDLDQIAHIWGWGSGGTAQEHLFVGMAGALSSSSRRLSRFDMVDIDADNIADFIIDDFNASGVIGPGVDLGEDGWIYVEVDMLPVGGGASVNAVVRVAVPEPATIGLLGFSALALLRRRK